MYICYFLVISVVDPHWFPCRSGSSILGQCGSGSSSGSVSRVMMTKNLKILPLRKILQKLQFIYDQASMKDIYPTNHDISLFFPVFVVFFALLDPDPADQNQCGSGSTTLPLINSTQIVQVPVTYQRSLSYGNNMLIQQHALPEQHICSGVEV